VDHEQTISLWRQGKSAWNQWADALCADKARLQADAQWESVSEARFSTGEEPFVFQERVDLSGWLFPGTARFQSAVFNEDVLFIGATFADDALFDEAEFRGAVLFGGGAGVGRRLVDNVDTRRSAQFASSAHFPNTKFRRGAGFENVLFQGDALFQKAIFEGDARFWGARFDGDVRFEGVDFRHDARFHRSRFLGYTSFREAVFRKRTRFIAVRGESFFSLQEAVFWKVPEFNQAHFVDAPRLDRITIHTPMRHFMRGASTLTLEHSYPDLHTSDDKLRESARWPWIYRAFNVARDQEDHARFRKLRSMASQGGDFENALLFNAQEIASRRFWVDRPWAGGFAKFWAGWVYEKLSGYGRSIVRPFAFWAALVLLSTTIYLGYSIAVNPGGLAKAQIFKQAMSCHPSYDEARTREVRDGKGQIILREAYQPTTMLFEAFILALRNAFIFDRADVSRRMFGCLYGVQDKGGQDYPTIPPFVSFVSSVQSLFSAVAIFLFGLAIRNAFRLR
jgi:uncharacterized protein YjbI with pentapeptide repeats